MEFAWLFGSKTSFHGRVTDLSFKFYMAIVEGIQHVAEDVEKLMVAGCGGDAGSVNVVLLLPVDLP